MVERVYLLIISLHGLRRSIGHCHLRRTVEQAILHVGRRLQLLSWGGGISEWTVLLIIRHGGLTYLVLLLYSVGHDLEGILEMCAESVHIRVMDAYATIWLSG